MNILKYSKMRFKKFLKLYLFKQNKIIYLSYLVMEFSHFSVTLKKKIF